MKLSIFKSLFITTLLFLSGPFAYADESTDPVGQWRTIDDETGQAKSIIEMNVADGQLQAKIVELINPSEPNPVCKKCEGDKKDQPITGMVIMWDVTNTGNNKWSGGKILDPKKGKTYKVKLSLAKKGQELKVRGYIGSPILGRTQVWERVN